MLNVIAVILCAGLVSAADVPFEAAFEEPLPADWQMLGGEPAVIADPDDAANHVLELAPSSKLMLAGLPPMADLTLEARVSFAEKRGWVEAPFLVRANDDGSLGIQVYLEQVSSQVIAVRYTDGVDRLGAAISPVPLRLGPWYTVKIVALGQRIGVWINGQPATVFSDPKPVAGLVGLRVGDARTRYDDLSLRPVSQEDKDALRRMRPDGRVMPETCEATFNLPADGEVRVTYPDIIRPLVPFEIALAAPANTSCALNAGGDPIAPDESGTCHVTLAGEQGKRTIEVLCQDKRVGTIEVEMIPDTTFQAGPYTDLFETLRDCIRRERDHWSRGDHVIASNPTWVRDHIHEMKAYKFWETDLTSFIDTLLDLQHPEGFFYEIIGEASHDHQTYVKPKHVRVEPEHGLCWIRLEMEADVEYLMVEGAYHIWQATGDLEAMRARLPHLEKGLEYDFTDLTRWDAQHGALKRTFSIDTWDFTYGISDHNRRIEPGLPMGIMHGDNSGLYQACRQLAEMFRIAGDASKAQKWDARAGELRERINKLCFNGRYYTHQILLQPVDTGVKEEDILSLSNTYDINRGLPTHEMALSIIDEYQARRKLRADTHFAEWFSIDPPYPQFGPYPAGHYINGGIAGFVAGELAKAAFHHGREHYAVDILNRVNDMVARDGTLYFLYDAQGNDMKGGPRGWGGAAVISALIEGLAGIQDNSAQFRDITLSPRFVAAGIDQAYICTRYGPSGAFVAMTWQHDPAQRRMSIKITGSPRNISCRILMPQGVTSAEVLEPSGVSGQLTPLEESTYLTLPPQTRESQDTTSITIAYTCE